MIVNWLLFLFSFVSYALCALKLCLDISFIYYVFWVISYLEVCYLDFLLLQFLAKAQAVKFISYKEQLRDFPGGSVVQTSPSGAEDAGWSLVAGLRSRMPHG